MPRYWIHSIGTLLALTSLVAADDWPQWLGPQRDGVWRETGILTKFPENGPKVLWRQPVAGGYAGPAVANGHVFVHDRVIKEGSKDPANQFTRGTVPSKERVLCFNAADGKPVWTHEYDCVYTVSYPAGPRCTPTVHAGKVYTLGSEGHFNCLDAATGKPVWAKDLCQEYKTKPPIWGFSGHPLIEGNTVISLVGGEGTGVVAFDKDTGKEVWRSIQTNHIGYCPPTIITVDGKRQLVIWHGQAVEGLEPATGKVLWSHPLQTYQQMAISTPRTSGNLMFLTSTFNISLALKFKEDGVEQAWKGNKKDKIGFDAVFGTPFIENGYVYGNDQMGQLTCIEVATGKQLWQTDTPNKGKKQSSSDLFIIKNGDRFFLVTEQGDLIIAKLTPEKYEELGRINLVAPTGTGFGREIVWSHPAFAHKCVFARNDKEIVCVSLAGE